MAKQAKQKLKLIRVRDILLENTDSEHTISVARIISLLAESGIDAYLIPSDDDHASEYVNDHFKSREWISVLCSTSLQEWSLKIRTFKEAMAFSGSFPAAISAFLMPSRKIPRSWSVCSSVARTFSE